MLGRNGHTEHPRKPSGKNQEANIPTFYFGGTHDHRSFLTPHPARVDAGSTFTQGAWRLEELCRRSVLDVNTYKAA